MGCLQSHETTTTNKQNLTKKPMDADIIILKAKKQRDQFLMQKKGLEKSAEQALLIARESKKSNNKQKAIVFLQKKKILTENAQSIQLKLDYIEKQILTLEQTQDNIEFTKIVKQNNDLMQELKDQVNTEEIIRAKELKEEIDIQSDEIQQLIADGNQDDEVLQAYDQLGDFDIPEYQEGFQQDIQNDMKQKEVNYNQVYIKIFINKQKLKILIFHIILCLMQYFFYDKINTKTILIILQCIDLQIIQYLFFLIFLQFKI